MTRFKPKLLFALGFAPSLIVSLTILRMFSRSSLIFDQINYVAGVLLVMYVIFLNFTKNLNIEIFVFLILFTLSVTQLMSSSLVNIDRSRSFYVLSWVRYSEVLIKNNTVNFDKVESAEKLNKTAMTQRLNEQISRGLVVKTQSKISLSTTGKFIVYISDNLASIANLNGWLNNAH